MKFFLSGTLFNKMYILREFFIFSENFFFTQNPSLKELLLKAWFSSKSFSHMNHVPSKTLIIKMNIFQ